MDNKIPKIIQDYLKKNSSETHYDFLSFNDWLSKNENQSSDWIIVARNQKIGKYSDYYTVSCLIQADNIPLKHFLSNPQWGINSSFGIPQKYQTPFEDEQYDDGLKIESDGIVYMPFTFIRNYHGYIPDHFQIIEHFLLYYNCFWIEEKKEYQSFNDDGELLIVAKIIDNENEETLLVDTHILKDYLAVRNSYLARFHDHKRRSAKDISTIIQKKSLTYELSDSESYFALDLRDDIQYDEVKSTSRLLGKDIIRPYPSPISHELLIDIDDNAFLDFVIGRDEKGKEVLSTCNPELLSSYFKDNGTPHFLTSVYFKREVLQKYYSEPKKYVVTDSSVEYLDFWGITISLTSENLIQVYLGDIGRNLPNTEQLNWRQFNTVPKGGIPEYRFKRDFLTEFATPEIDQAPITHFKEAFELLQEKFESTYGYKLFLELNKDDQHLYSTLHIPLTEEWKELDEQILALAKICTDSFNNKVLTKITGKNIGVEGKNSTSIKGLLALFYEYLTIIIPDNELRNSLIRVC